MNTKNIEPKPRSRTYTVSVYAETWMEGGYAAGETDIRETLIDREIVDDDDLVAIGRKRLLTVFDGRGFSSEEPDANRAHFERGEDTYYRMSVHEIDGKPPADADYRAIARLLGIDRRRFVIDPTDI